MKISKIVLNNYHQFKNLELDFTYPKEHPRAGQPLDKVCFIGPNGSGKTTILEKVVLGFYKGEFEEGITYYIKVDEEVRKLIEKFKYEYFKPEYLAEFKKNLGSDLPISLDLFDQMESIGISKVRDDFVFYVERNEEVYVSKKRDSYDTISSFELILELKMRDVLCALFLDARLDSEKKTILIKLSTSFSNNKIQNFGFWDISNQDHIILDENVSTDVKRTIVAMEVEDLQKNKHINNSDEKEYRLEKLFNQLGVVFESQNISFDQIKQENGNFDPCFKVNNEIVSLDDLSSGTKQYIYRALPLIYLNPSNYTILFDEPEVSLHPEWQKSIVNFYTQIGKNNQFFFATHSPFIASQFNKEELFILYFDQDGFVQTRHPDKEVIYLDLEGATETLYPGTKPKSPNTLEGQEKLNRLDDLRRKLEIAKKDGDVTEIYKLMPEYEKLAQDLYVYSYYPEHVFNI